MTRWPDYDLGKGDNSEQIVLPDHFFNLRRIDHSPPVSASLYDAIRLAQTQDASLDTILETGLAQNGERLPADHWTSNNGLLLYQDRIYVPDNTALRQRIIRSYHDSQLTGHPGRFKTLELIKRDFWWPSMGIHIRNYVDGCAICQSTKNQNNKSPVPILPITSDHNAELFEIVSFDFIGKLPPSHGYNMILVVVDQGCTKTSVYIPCHTTTGAEQFSELYAKEVVKRFGLPRKVISDRGPQFQANFTKELCRILGIEQNLSTAYHPRMDGQTERVNQELEQYLRAFCNYQQDNWALLLPFAEFVHNICHHATIKTSPFQALMGYQPQMMPSPIHTTKVPAVSDRIKHLEHIRDELHACSRIASELITQRTKNPIPQFHQGDQVWLEAKKHSHHTSNGETSTQTARSLPDRENAGTSDCKTATSPPMENSPCISHLSINTISPDI